LLTSGFGGGSASSSSARSNAAGIVILRSVIRPPIPRPPQLLLLATTLRLASGEDLRKYPIEFLVRIRGQGLRTPPDEIVWAHQQRAFTG
jgi:hypothetical protein